MLWLRSRWKSGKGGMGGERVNTRRDQGVLPECWGAQLRSRSASLGGFGFWNCAGWKLSLFPPLSLIFPPARLQHCPVVEWRLQGKLNVPLAFSSFCVVYPPHTSTPLLVFSISALLFLLFHLFFLQLFILCFYFSSFSTFFLSSFFFCFFTPLSRASCLSPQDGAVHPWPGLWGHSEKADPKAEGANTEVYRYGSERTHLHHTKV